mmetsp:Transcript_44476/g.123054  ORF Transcript_44476/g.123054 Transcript_44476/m.123054 type:complete len:184 (+) Transcript_44476:78-629(+)
MGNVVPKDAHALTTYFVPSSFCRDNGILLNCCKPSTPCFQDRYVEGRSSDEIKDLGHHDEVLHDEVVGMREATQRWDTGTRSADEEPVDASFIPSERSHTAEHNADIERLLLMIRHLEDEKREYAASVPPDSARRLVVDMGDDDYLSDVGSEPERLGPRLAAPMRCREFEGFHEVQRTSRMPD